MQQHSVLTVVELYRKLAYQHTESCSNPTDRRQRHVTVTLISPAAVIVKLFATVEVENNMFDRCWKCVAPDLTCSKKNMPRLCAPLVGTMVDLPTLRLGTVNVD